MKSFFKQVRIELITHFREPEVILWGFIFPALMILVLGFIFSNKKETQSIGVSQSLVSSEAHAGFVSGLESNESLVLTRGTEAEMLSLLSEGAIDLWVRPAEGSGVETVVTSEDAPKVEISRLKIEAIALKAGAGVDAVLEAGVPVSHDIVGEIDGKRLSVTYTERLVPGVLMYNLFMGCIFGIGIPVVRDKLRGKFKKLATTPLSKIQFVLVTSFGRIALMTFQITAVILVGYLFFRVSVMGNWLELGVAIFLSVWTYLIFGFAIASVSRSIEKAVALGNVFFILSTILSGAFFSTAQMPDVVQWLAYLLPPTAAIELVRGVYTYGDSIVDYPVAVSVLVGWFGLSLLLAASRFKWHED